MGRDKLYQACMKEHIDDVLKASRVFAENLDWNVPTTEFGAGPA